MSNLCWLSQFHQMLGFKEQLIHHEKYWPRSTDSLVSVSQISCSIQPAPTFMAVDWILKQEHSFAGIFLLLLQWAATCLRLGYQKEKREEIFEIERQS